MKKCQLLLMKLILIIAKLRSLVFENCLLIMKFIFKKIVYFIFSSTLLVSACAALTAKASCRKAFAPELPNPYTANEFEMRSTLSAVKGYMEG
jgi:hypothetical protein